MGLIHGLRNAVVVVFGPIIFIVLYLWFCVPIPIEPVVVEPVVIAYQPTKDNIESATEEVHRLHGEVDSVKAAIMIGLDLSRSPSGVSSTRTIMDIVKETNITLPPTGRWGHSAYQALCINRSSLREPLTNDQILSIHEFNLSLFETSKLDLEIEGQVEVGHKWASRYRALLRTIPGGEQMIMASDSAGRTKHL